MKETIRHYLERLKQIITKPRMTKLMVIGLVSLCAGLVVSLGVLGFSYLSCRGERGIIPIDERLITHSEGVTYEDGKYLIPRAGGELTIVFPDTYVNKLEYRFRTHMTHVCKVYYEKKNQYGDYEIKEAFDDQKRYFERSVLPVQGTIRSLTFAFEEGNSFLYRICIALFVRLWKKAFKEKDARPGLCDDLLYGNEHLKLPAGQSLGVG